MLNVEFIVVKPFGLPFGIQTISYSNPLVFKPFGIQAHIPS